VKDKLNDSGHLLQADVLENFIPSIGKTQWQTVYESRVDPYHTWHVFSALLEEHYLPSALKRDSWDFRTGDGLPGFCESHEKGETVTTYIRYGHSTDIRPFVLLRKFHGAWPTYPEICEEFRHLHNLAHDTNRNVLLDFDRSGYEIEVVRLGNRRVEVNLRHLKQFLAATRLNLAIYFDSVRYSNLSLAEVPEEFRKLEHRDGMSCYRLDVRECNFLPEFQSFSRLLGKVIILPPPLEEAGVWPFEKEQNEEEVQFIVGVDEAGKPVSFTAKPDKLSNYFGANPGACHYLTPVFFRKEVLSKYYSDPDRYTVSDGYLECLGLWSVQIDNNHSTHVVVFLGDLGRDLPYPERLHWRQFNVPPAGEISKVNFRRSFLAQFTEPQAPDLVFRSEHSRFVKDWATVHPWPLFLPFEKGDEHLIQTVRVPVTNSQSELDEQVLTLTKLLVDSLNEKAIEKEVGPGPEEEKGISKFERFLVAKGFSETEAAVRFLRDLQDLRSSGSGHRKGSRYQKALSRLGVDPNRKPDVMSRLLEEATALLRAFRGHFL